ncbi:MAG: ECF transporter S component [Lachnospiraceae bacterium]|nr:ECF transporter S component [Lachnospiraceae bacterium]
MKISTKKLVQTALLLALCVVSQFLKSGGMLFVIFVTGAIINACIILCDLTCGLWCAAILSVVTPITAFFIAPSPVTAAIPAVIPCIMIGNFLLAPFVHICYRKTKDLWGLVLGMFLGSIAKAVFMGVTISLILLPNFLPEKLMPKLTTFQITFSVVQLAAAAMGCIYAYIIWAPLRKYLKSEE